VHVTVRFSTVTGGTVVPMDRREIAPRPARSAGNGRSRAGRALAVALASIALLLCGAVDVLPRGAAGPPAASPAAAAPAPHRAGTIEAPSSSLGVRAAGLAAVAAPTGPGGGLPPTASPLVAPHLAADPQARPPTSPLGTSPAGAPGSRAPPGPAGT
jgi:hypothetical protein